jgi:hypothetical protein
MGIWIWRTSIELRRHVKGLVRAALYFLVLALVFGAVRVRSARAEWRTRTLELGRQMYELARATQHDVNRITMNGQPVWVGSSLSNDPSKTILERYAAHCSESSAQPPSDWQKVGEGGDPKAVKKSGLGLNTVRAGDEDEGTVICFTKSAHSKPSVREALDAFGETGDLGMLGSLRYAYVRKARDGRSVVLTAWTDDTFKIKELIPEEGKEAVGTDLPEVPRPPNSRRIMATRLEGTPFGVNLYEGTDAPDQVLHFYEKEMRALGYYTLDPELDHMRELEGKRDPNDPPGPIVRLFEKDGVVITMTAHPSGEGRTATGLGMAGASSTDDLDRVRR